jgi:hypothetical protein
LVLDARFNAKSRDGKFPLHRILLLELSVMHILHRGTIVP